MSLKLNPRKKIMLIYIGMVVTLSLISGGFLLAVGVVMLLLNVLMSGVFARFVGTSSREDIKNVAKWYGRFSFYATLVILLLSLIQVAGDMRVSEIFWVVVSIYIGAWVSGRLSCFMFDFYAEKLE